MGHCRGKHVRDDIVRSSVARLYPFWLWAYRSGDWSVVDAAWPVLRDLLHEAPNPLEEDCRNGHVAGLIAYVRLAYHMQDREAIDAGLRAARDALRERLTYEFSYGRGGLMTVVTQLRTVLGRWRHLTPEVGRLLAQNAVGIHRHLMATFVGHHRPAWFLAWNVETLWRNECPFEFPTASLEIFAARACILQEPAAALRRCVDIPWCAADLCYLQKLVYCIEATEKAAWVDVRTARG